MNVNGSQRNSKHGWRQCLYCSGLNFSELNAFLRHIRQYHCTQEGGSFVCRYGDNGVCSSLPLEGVHDRDYEDHVLRNHASTMYSKGSSGIVQQKESGSSQEKWGVYSSTQNIPAVLNDPRKGMKRDFFTKTWGEHFVEIKEIPLHVALPEVMPRHMESYEKKLRRRQKILNRIACLESIKKNEASAKSFTHPSHKSGPDFVPTIFLSSSFNLEESKTFYEVFTHITKDGISMENAKLLQEKLLHYLENVESDMSRQISKKSSAFFETMTYLNAQMEQLKVNRDAVIHLRKDMSKLHEDAVTKPTRILALPRRKNNILNTIKKLEMMSAVREVQTTIQVMLARQEFTAALDLIATTQDLLRSELSSVVSLKHLSSELSEHEKLIDKMVFADFIRYISEDLNRPLDDAKPLLEEEQLIAVVFGVLRLKKFDFLDNLKEEIYGAIKASVKQAVAEAVSEVEVDQETTSIADQARALSIPAWLGLLAIVTARLNIIIARIKVIVDVMKEAVMTSAGKTYSSNDGVNAATLLTMSNSGGEETMIDEECCSKILLGLKEVLCTACDFSHDRCAKLLHARSRDQGLDKMTAKEFLSLSRVIESFVEETEKVCGRKSTSFRMGLQGQATRFVARFHEERDGRLRLNLSNERWRPVPAPPDLQKLLDHIQETDSLVFPPEVMKNGITDQSAPNETSNSSNIDDLNNIPNHNSMANDTSEQIVNNSGGVIVSGEEYVVVGVCVVVVRLIVEYAECAVTLKLAAHQLLTRLAEILRRFNSDTCRLLIEAGAVALGLKTITIRNLALAWRALQLLLTLLPKVETHFSNFLKQSIVTKQVEQLTREYKEHCGAIENKIVGVMGDTLDRELKSWEAKSPVPSSSFNGILRAISKLHETVSGVLPLEQMQLLFGRVTFVLRSKLKIHLARLNVSSVGPKSWVVTSELTFYFNHLETLGVASQIKQEDFFQQLWPPR